MEKPMARRDSPLVLVGSTTSWNDLPVDLEMCILSRLPIKTLVSSSSVNKKWYSLITNPKFILAHISRSISFAYKNDEHFLLTTPKSMAPSHNLCSVISEKTSSVCQKFEIPFRTKTRTIKVVGSVHGLLCVTDESTLQHSRDLYLWNPCIRKYRALVSSCFKELLSDFLHTFPVVGLGFHEPTNDYKIVRILYRIDHEEPYNLKKLAPKVEVYSLRRNTWKKVRNAVVPRAAQRDSWAFVNGGMYWFEHRKTRETPELGWLLSFDFNDEVFSELKGPIDSRDWDAKSAFVTLMEFKGSVSLCLSKLTPEYGGCMRCCIWVMKDEGGGAVSWSKQFEDVLKQTVCWPLKFTKNGKLVTDYVNLVIHPTFHEEHISLVTFNLNNRRFQPLLGNALSTLDAAYMESLVLLEGGGNARSRLTE